MIIIQTQLNFSKYFTVLLVAYPILSLYSIKGSPISLSNVLLAISIICLFLVSYGRSIHDVHNKVRCSFLLPYYIYIIFHLLFVMWVTDSIYFADTLGSTLRYLLNLTPLVFFVIGHFDYKYGVKVYRIICLVSVYYALAQFIIYYAFGFYLPGYISTPLFPVINHQISEFEDNMLKSWFTVFRPRSFFAEPAHFAEYVLGYFTLCLFGECESQKQKWKDIIIILIGITVSLSSTGIITAIVLLSLFFILKLRKGLSIGLFIIIATIIPIAVFLLSYTSLYNSLSIRFETSAGYRFRSGEVLPNFTFFSVLFGKSMGYKAGFYMTGFVRLFAYFGIFGSIILFISILKAIKANRNIRFISLVIVFLILNVGTELLFQSILLPYFSFIIALAYQSLDLYKNEKEGCAV